MNSIDQDISEDHLIREWEQAWYHYRHLENNRNKYLGFFFTILLASVGFAVTILKGINTHNVASIVVGLIILAFLVFVITIGLFAIIKKLNLVLKRYECIMKSTRNHFNFRSSREFPFDLADMHEFPKEIMKLKIYSAHRVSELILASTSFVLMTTEICGAIYTLIYSAKFQLWQQTIAVLIAVITAIIVVYVFFPLFVAAIKSKEEKQLPRNQ